MNPLHRALLVTAVLTVATCPARGLAPTDSLASPQFSRIELKDGNTLVGTVQHESRDSLVLILPSGTRLALPSGIIRSRAPVDGALRGGEYIRLDPNRSRLLFGPTARPVKGGTGYVAVYEIFFPYAAFGVADVLTVAGGISLVPGAMTQLYYVGPKISVPLGDGGSFVAVGGHYAGAFGEEASGAGIAYAVATLGSQMIALSLGGGFGYVEGEFSDSPVLMLGGEAQVSGSVKLLTENWFPVGSEESLLGFGVRFFGDRVSADFGLYYLLSPGSTEGFPFLPWLGFSYAFGP
jgi:hypothetical protein